MIENTNFYRILIKGIVQGVGFRPFLFNLARKHNINGIITNKGNIGVELIVSIGNFSSGKAGEKLNDNEKYAQIESFIAAIKEEKPPISYIENISYEKLDDTDLTKKFNLDPQDITQSLKIMPSVLGTGEGLTLPPDIAICDSCLKDMYDKTKKRYYHYPFIACAQCGPRYTTVTELPYDRARTTMADFPLCRRNMEYLEETSCFDEYSDFNNRRFHAQTFSCKNCGPNYFLIDKLGLNLNIDNSDSDQKQKEGLLKVLRSYLSSKKKVSEQAEDAIKKAADLIKKGNILAVMGIGGVHLVGLATDYNVVKKLRERKKDRKFKPFAVMMRNLEIIKRYAEISLEEEKIIQSFRRPIVLLNKKNTEYYNNINRKYNLAENIAPGLNNIGIMLPYTGVHYLLFDYLEDAPLIYTSGNVSGLPMAITPEDVLDQLFDLADAFLLHNRRIFQRTDDSVLRVHKNYGPKIIRRSRGYVPEYIPLPFKTGLRCSIAVGPELNSTGSVARGYRIFPTQHIGNVTNMEVQNFLKDAIFHIKELLKIKNDEIDLILHDLHPLFNSTKLAEELYRHFDSNTDPDNSHRISPELIAVQHHFAHAASLMVDNMIPPDKPCIVATLDGVGYGSDGNVWGGEIIYGTYDNFKRIAHLEYIPMIGGDRCVKFPDRMLMGFLIELYGCQNALKIAKQLGLPNNLEYHEEELKSMVNMYKNNANTAYSSSCGRLLDAISALLDICHLKTYRGEPAMRLEGNAFAGDPLKYDFHSEILNDFHNNSGQVPQVSQASQMPQGPQPYVINSKMIIHKILQILGVIIPADNETEKELHIDGRTNNADSNSFLLTKDNSKYILNHDYNQIKKEPHKFQIISDIAASVLYSLGVIFAEISLDLADKFNVRDIGLSGGVAYNHILYSAFYKTISQVSEKNKNIDMDDPANRFRPLHHKRIPPGDAGISIGQIAIGAARYNRHNSLKNKNNQICR
ncbi:MAG: carbamoyltransferase HypF [Promethearchaeota archaeon]